MRKFLIFSRGRTGSSAIADEFNMHPDVTCHGEVFWPKLSGRPKLKTAYEEFGREYFLENIWRDRIMLYAIFSENNSTQLMTEESFNGYFNYLVLEAQKDNSLAVGGKFMNCTNPPRRDLLDWCYKADVHLVYLSRQNILRQVISGMVARKLKVRNRVNYSPEEKRNFTFNPKKVLRLIKKEVNKRENTLNDLQKSGVIFIEVSYEEWCKDRETLLLRAFNFLDVPAIVPAVTRFCIMTPEPLSKLISNYDAVAHALKKNGFGHFLEDELNTLVETTS